VKRFLIVSFVLVQGIVSAQQLFNETALIDNLKYLSADALEGRKPETKGGTEAQAFIKTQFKQLGLQALGNDYELPFDFEGRENIKVNGINIAGWIKGTSRSDEYIVISAHYDHVGIRNDKIYNGADDNASGVGALIALGEYFQKNKPVHSIILVAFDAEEMGLQGAKAFVKTPPIPIEKIRVNINMDMVARADDKALVACGTHYYPQLKPFIEKMGNTEKVRIILGHDDPAKYKGSDNWTQSSDHGPFHLAKIPFVYFGVADHGDYHKPTDDFEKVDIEIYKTCVRLIVRISGEIDKGLN
jgi:Peptidase family M28